ncbi:hypothetical protein O3P69_008171 [Scylla paramamosain]|uniref:Uncharacterized protein n=1 Tax=Scylla paramamosain TaxID=85552 RepID=A0AAW0T0V1_SCYPA
MFGLVWAVSIVTGGSRAHPALIKSLLSRRHLLFLNAEHCGANLFGFIFGRHFSASRHITFHHTAIVAKDRAREDMATGEAARSATRERSPSTPAAAPSRTGLGKGVARGGLAAGARAAHSTGGGSRARNLPIKQGVEDSHSSQPARGEALA